MRRAGIIALLFLSAAPALGQAPSTMSIVPQNERSDVTTMKNMAPHWVITSGQNGNGDADYSIALGYQAGYSNTGANNLFVGSTTELQRMIKDMNKKTDE